MVRADISGISIIDLTEYMHPTSSRLEGGEECSIDLLGTVKSYAINGIVSDELCDPSFPHGKYIGVLGTKVRETDGVVTFPALETG